jgi:8-oxo-dGTP pyrophosphatase MutT (NUDIX family)
VTSLRETEEEVGIGRDLIHVVGRIPSLLTITGYWIQPFVGILKCSIEEAPFTLDPAETAGAYWISLQTLLHPDTYQRELFAVGSVRYPIDVFQVDQHRIWGATGAMTKNLLDRLNSIR